MPENIFTEALNSPKLTELITSEIRTARKKRDEVVLNSKAKRLKSDAFSALDEKNMLSPHRLKDEFILILTKQSTLPARERAWITAFMDYIIANTAIHLKQQKVIKESTPKT